MFQKRKNEKNQTIKFFDWRLKVKAYDLFKKSNAISNSQSLISQFLCNEEL